MATRINLKDKIFSGWTVVSEATPIKCKSGKPIRVWNCICKCGTKVIVRQSALISGGSKGCVYCPKTHGLTNHVLYNIWQHIKDRCNNTDSKDYKDYGGRGIRMCERWNDLTLFIEDMFPTYNIGLSIGRIDNNLGYTPLNCKWETSKEQANNRRSNKIIKYQGKNYTIKELSEKTGIIYNTLWFRLKRGWSITEAIKGRRLEGAIIK